MKFRILLAVLCLMPWLGHAMAESTIEHTINSNFPQQQRHVSVTLPKSYQAQGDQQYPTLYLLDGENNRQYTQAVADFLVQNGLVPELIIVAMHAGATRARDYLPANSQGQGAASGQAAVFREYLTKELIPLIEQQYRAAPVRMLSGHSYGGVFVLDTLAVQPRLFQAYFAQSPYLDPSIEPGLLPRLSEQLQKQSPGQSHEQNFLHVLLGDEPDLAAGIAKLQGMLEKHAGQGLRWEIERDSGKTHMTTRMIGQYDALEAFYQGWPLSQEAILSGKSAGVKAHIDALSERYAYPVLYSEQVLAQATQMFLLQGDLASAKDMADLFTGQYPKSPLARFMLANIMAGSGQVEQARGAVNKAIELYEADPKPSLQPLYAGMRQLRQQLGVDSVEEVAK